MSIRTACRVGGVLLLLAGGIWAVYQLYPIVLYQLLAWQKEVNVELAGALKSIQAQPQQAGLSLLLISFLYGVFHAVGPGHGKFILTSYLSFEPTTLPKALKITWFAALVQGAVAIGLVTLLVAILTLSREYFNLTLKWVERGSFGLMIGFGLYWLYPIVHAFLQKKSQKRPLVIRQIRPFTAQHQPMRGEKHPSNCGCGHKHLPSSQEMASVSDWTSLAAVVLSIGLRPCTGAIFVLFLSYTLDLYFWGMISALVMAVGTGLSLTLFACLVLFARSQAIQASRWYISIGTRKQLVLGLKLLVSIALIGLGSLLLHGSFIESSTILLRR